MDIDNNNIIGKGAEATIYLDGNIVRKEREVKGYRIPFIDDKLRKFRTRREGKVISKLQEIGFSSPNLIKVDDKNMSIEMDYLKGEKLRDVFESDFEKYSFLIGQMVGTLHNNDIIHADLTTSNMIVLDKLYFIDFGLSFFSEKVEDKACDLHLLKQAIMSKHHTVFDLAFNSVVSGYKKACKDANLVLERLEEVEKRGRNKNKH